jgi:hypothetical protein
MSKLKKEFLGQMTFSRLLNKMIEINEANEFTLLSEGREDLFNVTNKKALKEVKKADTPEAPTDKPKRRKRSINKS